MSSQKEWYTADCSSTPHLTLPELEVSKRRPSRDGKRFTPLPPCVQAISSIPEVWPAVFRAAQSGQYHAASVELPAANCSDGHRTATIECHGATIVV